MMLAAVDWHVVWQRLFHPNNVFWRALWTTVYIAIAAQLIGIVLGLVAALMRESKVAPLRWLSGLYVLVFRGTPVLVQLYFIYFGVNILFGVTVIPTTLHLGLFSIDGAVVAGILALVSIFFFPQAAIGLWILVVSGLMFFRGAPDGEARVTAMPG